MIIPSTYLESRFSIVPLIFIFRPNHYHLEVIQHPIKTAEFRNASLSRLPLTPPLVARLTVSDARGTVFVP